MRSRSSLRLARFLALTASAWLLSFSSSAAAAVYEIDQSCAVDEWIGCFPGDSPGFPVTITLPGAYRLTSNLDVRGVASPSNVTAIQVEGSADGVSIDLNGFALLGPNSCPAPPAPCTANGDGDGLRSVAEGTEVRDGSVSGFGKDGVTIFGSGARVDRVRAWWNGEHGIEVERDGAVVVDSAAYRNGYWGIHVNTASVTGTVALQNGGSGFYLEGSTTSASELVAWGNGDAGFHTTTWNASVSFSLANANLGSGLTGHVYASVGDANGRYGLEEGNAFLPYTSTLQSVYANNASGWFGPAGITSIGQNACNGGPC